MNDSARAVWLLVLSLVALSPAAPAAAQEEEALEVFNAGSLALPFHRLLQAFEQHNPGVTTRQESSGSLAAVRKLTELGRIPDILALADRNLFPQLLQPRYTEWYATFARNAMVLAASPYVAAGDRAGRDWFDLLLAPDSRWGRADPGVDPAGYRTLMVFQLAERHYRRPGLAARLVDRGERRFVRPKSADLVALLQVGELDYAWLYSSVARVHGLPVIDLPAAINLSDPSLADEYRWATVKIPGRSAAAADSLEVRGSPIELGLSIPAAAPHPDLAARFTSFVLSPEGQAILREGGLITVDPPVVYGPPPAGAIP